jgi:hypothetical protein
MTLPRRAGAAVLIASAILLATAARPALGPPPIRGLTQAPAKSAS